jgi:hypothetical protein
MGQWVVSVLGHNPLPIFIRLTCEFLRVDRHVGSEFVLSGQVGDLEPELLVDGCLYGGLGVVDDVAQVAEAGEDGADVVAANGRPARITGGTTAVLSAGLFCASSFGLGVTGTIAGLTGTDLAATYC